MSEQQGPPGNAPSPDEHNRLGRAMTFIGWIIALALLTLFSSRLLDRQRNPNQHIAGGTDDRGAATVVLERNRQGHYIATAQINGLPVEVMLDTGATLVSIPSSLARRLALEKGPPMQSSTANGTITTHATTLDSVQLGDITLHKVRASINPNDSDILLGMSFLKQLEFTQRGDTLILRDYRR